MSPRPEKRRRLEASLCIESDSITPERALLETEASVGAQEQTVSLGSHPAKRQLVDKIHQPFRSPWISTVSRKAETTKPKIPKVTATQGQTLLSPTSKNEEDEHTIQSPVRYKVHPTLVIARLHEDIDALEQGIRLASTPSRDLELAKLTKKWKAIAQSVAEELFGAAQDKVNRAGGVEGMRAREEAARRRKEEWHAEGRDAERAAAEAQLESSDEDGSVEGADEDEHTHKRQLRMNRNEEKRIAREALRDSRDQDEDTRSHDVDGYDDTTDADAPESIWGTEIFTMGTMLRAIGIDIDAVGFDIETEQWDT